MRNKKNDRREPVVGWVLQASSLRYVWMQASSSMRCELLAACGYALA
ncbi:hypothetical protein [Rhodopirellula sp. SWK7]|nr:hypothetical protein [Rhodopirellula sp. SWK7]